MDNIFDVIVIGTGLSESMTATALSRAGLRVAHIDPNPYYGADEATLTLDELIQWAEEHSTGPTEGPTRYRVDYLSSNHPSNPKQYSISMSPSVIPSVGPFISSVIASGVARYGSYKLLGPLAIYRNGEFQTVPQNKESIFQDRTIPLIEKRRLMRFLMFASGEFEKSPELEGNVNVPFDCFLRDAFSLSEAISEVIIFSLACCNFRGEPTTVALHRVRSCLRSAGRYGSSPYLVGYYGGSGEIIQGFCRATAVNGGVYILGRKISNCVIDETQGRERYSIELEDIPDSLRSSCILSSMACMPHSLQYRGTVISGSASGTTQGQVHAVARCIAIVNGTVVLPRSYGTDDLAVVEGQSDSFMAVFPPGSCNGGSVISSVTLLTAGSGTLSAPQEKNIIYLSMPLCQQEGSSKELLDPYLARVLDLNPTSQCIFQLFYMQYFPTVAYQPMHELISGCFVFPHLEPDIFQIVDNATLCAENAYWSAIQVVNPERFIDRESQSWMEYCIDGIHQQEC